IRDDLVTGVQTCALPIFPRRRGRARLDDRRHPGPRGLVHAVAEWKEGVARQNRPRRVMALLACLVDGEEGRVHARHLTRPDADRSEERSCRESGETGEWE